MKLTLYPRTSGLSQTRSNQDVISSRTRKDLEFESGYVKIDLEDYPESSNTQFNPLLNISNSGTSSAPANLSIQLISPPPVANESRSLESPRTLRFSPRTHTHTPALSKMISTSTSVYPTRTYGTHPVPSRSPVTPLTSSGIYMSEGNGYLYPPIPAPLLHSHSSRDTFSAAFERGSSNLSRTHQSNMMNTERIAPICRTVSTSIVPQPVPDNSSRYANSAGASLPHIPRRKSGGASKPSTSFCLTENLPLSSSSLSSDEVGTLQIFAHSPDRYRPRPRSQFTLGEESTSESGSGSEDDFYAQNNEDISGEEVLQQRDSSYHSESGSECTTPTPSSVARTRENFPLILEDAFEIFNSGNTSRQAPQGERGRTEIRKRLIHEEQERNSKVSTIVFPSSSPPKTSSVLSVMAPSPPRLTVNTSIQNVGSLREKRENAGSLHLDLSLQASSPPVSYKGIGTGIQFQIPRPEPSRTLSESASLNDIPLIRKKSGEVVRSSMKSRSSSATRHRPCLSMSDLSSLPMPSPSASAPTTPSASVVKMVHFDSKLEHVKLFLSEQKPAAVSRDGSPISDGDETSGEDSDHGVETPTKEVPRPRRLRPEILMNDDELPHSLTMRVINMPPYDFEMHDAVNVRLEGIYLTEDTSSVRGTVRVRNIAFEKNIAIRFTLDGWQTTSEILGSWVESVSSPMVSHNPAYDRFAFNIHLADIMPRLEEKTLVLAIKFVSGSQEYWDNNSGENYRAIFERRKTFNAHANKSTVRIDDESNFGKNSSCKTTGSRVLGSSLHSALEKIVNGDGDKTNNAIAFGSPAKKHADPLLGRYDLAQSLRDVNTTRPSFDHTHTRNTRSKVSCLHGPPTRSRMANLFPLSQSGNSQGFSSMFHSEISKISPQAHEGQKITPNFMQRTHSLEAVSLQSSPQFSFNGSCPIDKADNASHLYNTRSDLSFDRITLYSRPEDPSLCQKQERRHIRNYQRASYFDTGPVTTNSLFGTGKARLTPPGTPGVCGDAFNPTNSSGNELLERETSLNNSLIQAHPSLPFVPRSGLTVDTLGHNWSSQSNSISSPSVGSEISTPSVISHSSSSLIPSPSSPADLGMLTPIASATSPPNLPISNYQYLKGDPYSMNSDKLNDFLNRFCFYRGSDDLQDLSSSVDIRRTHSASCIEELLSSPCSSNIESFPLFHGPNPSEMYKNTVNPHDSSPEHMKQSITSSPSTSVSTPPTSSGLLKVF